MTCYRTVCTASHLLSELCTIVIQVSRCAAIIERYQHSVQLEVQQRSCEYGRIFKHDAIRSQLLERMPALDESDYYGTNLAGKGVLRAAHRVVCNDFYNARKNRTLMLFVHTTLQCVVSWCTQCVQYQGFISGCCVPPTCNAGIYLHVAWRFGWFSSMLLQVGRILQWCHFALASILLAFRFVIPDIT